MVYIKTKIPIQSRSKALVAAILEATSRILLTHGMKRLTTNHIAELAGVSIGSLYQYFSNKESIVVKLIETQKENEYQRISKIMLKLQQNPTCQLSKSRRKENIRLVLKELVDIHSENIELSRVLNIQTQNLTKIHPLRDTSAFLTDMLYSLLNKIDKISQKDNYTRAYIITNSLDSLLQKTLVNQPKLFKKPEFLDELVNLSMGYLQPA